MIIKNIDTIFFDFDGVIVDSVNIKGEAFSKLWEYASETELNYIKNYHNENGGVSRYKKIKHFLEDVFYIPATKENILKYTKKFSQLVKNDVINCEYIPGVIDFLNKTKAKNKFIISGTPQDELEEILEARGLSKYFIEILGTPIDKKTHLSELIKKYNYNPERCLFLGDALTDYEAAQFCNTRFILINSKLELNVHKLENFKQLNPA